jgi:hypothetical protein
MDQELEQLLERARGLRMTPDDRITLETMQAARTTMIAAERPKNSDATSS